MDGLLLCKCLQSLGLSFSMFCLETVNILKSVMQSNKFLAFLNLESCNIDIKGFLCIISATKEIDMRDLDLSNTTSSDTNNVIGEKGSLALADELTRSKSFTQLYLTGCGIQAEGAIHLSLSLQQNSVLTDLDLAKNSIHSRGARYLAIALKTKTLHYFIYAWLEMI